MKSSCQAEMKNRVDVAVKFEMPNEEPAKKGSEV
jgi:hypothetical protein